MSKINIVVCNPREEPKVEKIDDSLNGMQAVVGGMSELVILGSYDLYCNEEGLLLNLPFNRYVGGIRVVGPFFVCKSNSDGDTVGLSSKDIDEVIGFIKSNSVDWE
jgi:hypothetical protein